MNLILLSATFFCSCIIQCFSTNVTTQVNAPLDHSGKFLVPASQVREIPLIDRPLNPWGVIIHQTRFYGGCIDRVRYDSHNFSTVQPWVYNFDYIISGCGVDWHAPGPPWGKDMFSSCIFSLWALRISTATTDNNDTYSVDRARFFPHDPLRRKRNTVIISVHPDWRHIRFFLDVVLPLYEARADEFSVIVHTGVADNYAGDAAATLLKSKAIVKWTSEQVHSANEATLLNPKLVLLPTGVCQYELDRGDGDVLEEKIRSAKPWAQRQSRVLFCFHNNLLESREEWHHWAKNNCSFCDVCSHTDGQKVSHSDLWGLYCSYKFVASPLGRGVDCGRTFEILLMGAVPLIGYSSLANAYIRYPFSNLTAELLHNVTEIHQENLTRWDNNRLASGFNGTSRQFLTHEFWSRYLFEL